MIDNLNPYSPVNQDFIWIADYVDGTYLSEYDFVTKKENSFYDIQKIKLLRFGLLGHGLKMYFESNGIFKIAGRMIEFIYRVNDKDYYLTGQNIYYNDIIHYKDAVSDFNPYTINKFNNQTVQYNFGYKQIIKIDDIAFNFKAICKIPFNKPIYMNIRLVSNKNLNGRLIIKKNSFNYEEIDAPLKANAGGELNWIIK